MRAAIYSRKSKESIKGESIENQIEKCREWCDRNDYSEILIYEDEGFTGANLKRPQFMKMMKDAREKKFDALVCYKLDRVSRSVSDFSVLIKELSDINISFISVKENFDFRSSMGLAMMHVSSVFAQLERETIAERIRDNMYALAKTGRWLGGNAPLGFELERKGYENKNGKYKELTILKPIPEEVIFIQQTFNLYLELGSLGKLYKKYFSLGIKTKNGSNYTLKSLNNILRQTVYVKSSKEVIEYIESRGGSVYGEPNNNGIINYRKTKNRNTKMAIDQQIFSISNHEGIVDSSTWLKVQLLIDRNKDLAPRIVNGSGIDLLGSLVHCKKCGSVMVPKTGHRNSEGVMPRYFVCKTKMDSEGSLCDCKNVRVDELEGYVINELFEYLENKDRFYKNADIYIKTIPEENKSYEELGVINAEILKRETQIDNLVNKISTTPELFDMFKPKLETFKKEIEILKKQKIELDILNEDAKSRQEQLDVLLDLCLKFRSFFEVADRDTKKMLLRQFITFIEYDDVAHTTIVKINPFKKSLFNEVGICTLHRKAIIDEFGINLFKDTNITNTIHSNLKILRRSKNICQEIVANSCGVSKTIISKIEKGQAIPSKEVSEKLATLFNLDTKYFFDDYYENISVNFTDKISKILYTISRKDFCEKVGISPATLKRILSGKPYSKEVAYKIKEKFPNYF